MNTPKPSPYLTPDQMHTVLTDWHAHYVNDPLYLHMASSFEDVADDLWRAMQNLKAAQEEADWLANQRETPGQKLAWLGLHDLRQAA